MLRAKAQDLDGRNHDLSFDGNMGVSINSKDPNSPKVAIAELLSVIDTVFGTDYGHLYQIAEEKANSRIAERTNTISVLTKSNAKL